MFNFKLLSSLKGLLAQSCIRYIGLRLQPECLTLTSAALSPTISAVYCMNSCFIEISEIGFAK